MSEVEAEVEAEELRPRWRRDIILFLSGQSISLLGSSLVQYAILWYLTLRTQSGVVLTLATVFGFLPQAVMSIFGGVWADRHNRKFLLIGSDAAIAVTTLALALLLWSGVDDLWPIYVALAIRSAGAGIQTPAVGALIPQLVPGPRLIRINGINMSIQSSMTLIAPAFAAVLFAWLGLQAVLFVDVITAVVGIGLVALIPVTKVVRTVTHGYFGDLRAGLGYVVTHPIVRRVLAFFAVVMVLMAAPGYLSPLMVVRTFGDEVWKLTVNELAFGAGMLVGGAAIAAWGGWRDRMRMLRATALAFGLLAIGLGLSGAVFGWSGNFAIYLTIMLVLGVAVAFYSTSTMTMLQEQVESEMQGRVFGVSGIVTAVAMPIGMVIFGPMSDHLSIEIITIIAGLLTIVASAIVGFRAPQALAPTH
jgi:DHA3 family macrolide efflux protein-like MFS transporter